MKISTSWSQRDWERALEKVWKLSRDFEEILNFGLDHGFISSSDIIQASDIYKDPNKEYDDDEIKEIISSKGLGDILGIIQEEYSLYDILDELPKNEILDEFDNNELLDHLENSYELDQHDEEVKTECYNEYINEYIKELENRDKDYINYLTDADGDELHRFICDIIGCGYYDKEGLKRGLEKIKNKLNKNSYDISYEE